MFESRSRVVLLMFSTVASAAAFAQQPAPPSAPTAQGQALQLPPEVAAERDAFQRRAEASVPIEDLIAEVASSSGKEFLIDPRVRAHVLAVPELEDPSYATLLSVLRMHGYMAVEIGGKVNVIPDANARSVPTRLLQRDDSSVPDDEWVTRVITVPGNNAANLVPILRPMLPQSAHLAALVTDQASNKLIVVDTYANVRRLTELIENLD
jgi:general secretion pathway protein D